MTDLTSLPAHDGRPSLTPGLQPPSVQRGDDQPVRVSSIAAIVVEHWLTVACAGLVFAAATIALLLTTSRKFEASVTVAPISTSRQLNLPGGLAGSLLGTSMSSGLQATPVFVARLARLGSVLSDVALTRVPGDTSEVIVERVLHERLSEIPPHTYARAIDRVLFSSVDRESGTVTFQIVLPDSALARVAVEALIGAVRRTFTRTNKSQAAELREAQLTRVDSTRRMLQQAQAAVVAFSASNRSVPPYSQLWIEEQRLAGNLQIAQSTYAAAVADLSSAAGRELEDTPALVVLDSVPANLPPRGRNTVIKALLAGVFGALLALAFVITREAAVNAAYGGASDAHRLLTALSRLPVVGGPVFRWFIRQPT